MSTLPSSTSLPLTAYDYSAQGWVTGPEARPLLVAQLSDTIDLLAHPDRGAEYAQFVGVNREAALASARRQLALLST